MLSLKVEVLVPKFYNDKSQVKITEHRKTAQELTKKFGGCTQETSPLIGQWKDPITKRKYSDVNFAFWVICDDNPSNILFLEKFKDKLKSRYRQQDILIYSIAVTRI